MSDDFVTRGQMDHAITASADGMRVEFRHGDETIALQMTGMKELLDEKFKSLKLWGSLALLAGSMTGTAVAAKIGAVNGAVHTASHALSYIL